MLNFSRDFYPNFLFQHRQPRVSAASMAILVNVGVDVEERTQIGYVTGQERAVAAIVYRPNQVIRDATRITKEAKR